MPWFAGIGVAVAAAVGTTIAVTSITAIVVGVVATAVVGAAVGALYAGVTGGSIGKGALWGAFGALAIVGGGSVLSSLGAFGGGTAAAGTTGGYAVGANGPILTGGAAVEGGAAAAGGGIFTASNMIGMATIASSMGSAFLKGDAEQTNADHAIQAQKEMAASSQENAAAIAAANREAALQQARIAAESDAARSASAERMSAADRAARKEQFNQEFQESIFRDRETRKEEADKLKKIEEGTVAGAQYAAGHTVTISPVEANRKRKDLLRPSWSKVAPTTSGATSSATEQGLTPGGPGSPGGQISLLEQPAPGTPTAVPPVQTGVLGG